MTVNTAKAKRKYTDNRQVRSARLYKPTARSKITNGRVILPNVDGRTFWVRRYRDIVALFESDQGGHEAVSEAVRAIIRRASALCVELERLEMLFASAGEATPQQLELHGRTSNTLRRLLEAVGSVGLQRRPRDITPSVEDYVRHIAEQEEADA